MIVRSARGGWGKAALGPGPCVLGAVGVCGPRPRLQRPPVHNNTLKVQSTLPYIYHKKLTYPPKSWPAPLSCWATWQKNSVTETTRGVKRRVKWSDIEWDLRRKLWSGPMRACSGNPKSVPLKSLPLPHKISAFPSIGIGWPPGPCESLTAFPAPLWVFAMMRAMSQCQINLRQRIKGLQGCGL